MDAGQIESSVSKRAPLLKDNCKSAKLTVGISYHLHVDVSWRALLGRFDDSKAAVEGLGLDGTWQNDLMRVGSSRARIVLA